MLVWGEGGTVPQSPVIVLALQCVILKQFKQGEFGVSSPKNSELVTRSGTFCVLQFNLATV